MSRENEDSGVTDEQIFTKRNEIYSINDELDDAITGLDRQLDQKLKKQEHDYLKGYSMYVKQKEKDLREIIAKLNKNNEGNSKKENEIYCLKNTIKRMNDEQIRSEQEKSDLKEKLKYWKSRSDAFEQDKIFLQDQVLEGKRKNKLLKLAISRLQDEMEKKDEVLKANEPGAVGGAVKVV